MIAFFPTEKEDADAWLATHARQMIDCRPGMAFKARITTEACLRMQEAAHRGTLNALMQCHGCPRLKKPLPDPWSSENHGLFSHVVIGFPEDW